MSSSPLSTPPSSPQRQVPLKRRNVKPPASRPGKKMRACDVESNQETLAMPRSTNLKEKIVCDCGMTLRPSGLDMHLKTHPSHTSAPLSSEDEGPIVQPRATTRRRKTATKSVTMPKPKPKVASSADASKVGERRVAPLPSRAPVPVPSERPEAPAAPRVTAKPAVRRPKKRLTRREYYTGYFFGSSGEEEVSTGSSTEEEGGPVQYDADDSDNEADTHEQKVNEIEEDGQSRDEDESKESVNAYTHPLEPNTAYGATSKDEDDTASSSSSSPLSQHAPLPAQPLEPVDVPQPHPDAFHYLEPINSWQYGSAYEDSDDSDETGSSSSSSSSSPLSQPAPAPIEPISVPQPHMDALHSLRPTNRGMYGSSSSEDSDDGSSSSSSSSSPVAKPVNIPQPRPDSADMDVDTDDELDSLFSTTSDYDNYSD